MRLYISIEGFLIAILLCHCKAQNSSFCPSNEWVAYTDSKCFKIVKTYSDGSNAVAICESEGDGTRPITPATIKTSLEQQFLTQYVFNTSELHSSLWFGLSKSSEGEYTWVDDGSTINYSNWADDNPSNDTERGCVELAYHLSKVEDGQWRDVPCEKANFVLCETLQQWSIYDLQKYILTLRREVEEEIAQIISNPVPIGFVYVQFPDQPNPQVVWPNVIWEDQSSIYEGLFFRAEGGNSSPFGTPQNESSSRLTEVRSHDDPDSDHLTTVTLVPGVLSQPVRSGRYAGSGDDAYAVRFLISNVENRPVNTAIRIWVRIA